MQIHHYITLMIYDTARPHESRRVNLAQKFDAPFIDKNAKSTPAR